MKSSKTETESTSGKGIHEVKELTMRLKQGLMALFSFTINEMGSYWNIWDKEVTWAKLFFKEILATKLRTEYLGGSYEWKEVDQLGDYYTAITQVERMGSWWRQIRHGQTMYIYFEDRVYGISWQIKFGIWKKHVTNNFESFTLATGRNQLQIYY